jgi:peptide/nickel transport system permease protein
VFYLAVIVAEMVAPYDPYFSELNASLLPPTDIYWRNPETGSWLGPHVYPTTQGPVSLEPGSDR